MLHSLFSELRFPILSDRSENDVDHLSDILYETDDDATHQSQSTKQQDDIIDDNTTLPRRPTASIGVGGIPTA